MNKKGKGKAKAKVKAERVKRKGIKKPPSVHGMELKYVAAIICSYLTDLGFDPVLTGQACAAIYGGSSIKTNGLDFVLSGYVEADVKSAMKVLGFRCKVHRTYANKRCPYDVSFFPPPLTVGDDIVYDYRLLKSKKGDLKMLSPTDCVRQRLGMYYRFGNLGSLKEAVKVARRHDVDLNFIKNWSKWEWASDRFDIFIKLLKSE